MPHEIHVVVEDADNLDTRIVDGGEQDYVTTAPAAPRDVQGAQVPTKFSTVPRARRLWAVTEIAQNCQDRRPVAACLLDAEMLGRPQHYVQEILLGRRGKPNSPSLSGYSA